jgi:hypothetical protein
MALPKNTFPTFELKLPSTGALVKYRPWLVGEQKHLLMALQGGESEILLAVKEAVNTCTFGKLDIDNMPNFDMEYLFLQIRTKSAGESIDLVLTCQHCEEKSEYSLNLSDVQVQKNEKHLKKIVLSPELGCEMKYPTTEQLTALNKNYSVETVYNTICECIESVFTEDEVHYTKDETLEEIQEFLESLTAEQMEKIEDFFRTMPVLKHTFQSTCQHCEKVSEYTLEGIEAFFV